MLDTYYFLKIERYLFSIDSKRIFIHKTDVSVDIMKSMSWWKNYKLLSVSRRLG